MGGVSVRSFGVGGVLEGSTGKVVDYLATEFAREHGV